MKRYCAITILLCASAAGALGTPRHCDLPLAVKTVLGEHWQGWRLLQLADLRKDDQTLWQQHPLNGEHCPGLAKAKFDGEHSAFLFTLIQGSKQAVMIATPEDDTPKITVLGRPIEVAYFSVVNVFPPGTYKDFYTRKPVRIRNASAAVEAIEHNITLFYYDNGRWKSLLISD